MDKELKQIEEYIISLGFEGVVVEWAINQPIKIGDVIIEPEKLYINVTGNKIT